jgi:hypothetical protein
MGLKMSTTNKFRAAYLSLLALLAISVQVAVAPLCLNAQTTTASLSGTVTDSSGAVVAKAKVTLTNTTNGATQSTVSNKAGVFSFNSVQSGDYTLTITAKNFATFDEEGIHLDPQDKRDLRSLSLKVGSASETVVVEAEQGPLDVEGGEISSLISAEDIKHSAGLHTDFSRHRKYDVRSGTSGGERSGRTILGQWIASLRCCVALRWR